MEFLSTRAYWFELSTKVRTPHARAVRALEELDFQGMRIHIAPQVLIEFRAVATRPLASNGLGISSVDAEQHSLAFETAFSMVPESPAVFRIWKSLVSTAVVLGKQVHDARLVSICLSAGISQILTFNLGHFRRYIPFVPGLQILDPASY